MRPGRPPVGFWKPKCCPNHQKSLQKWIRKRQIAPSKKSKISAGENSGKNNGKQLLKWKRSKDRTPKMLIFQWFLHCNMHVRLLHTWLKSRRTRGRRGSRKVWKIDNQQRQKSHFLMKIWQKLAKHENQLQKSPPRQIFQDFGLILGSPGKLKITKNGKKSKPKK